MAWLDFVFWHMILVVSLSSGENIIETCEKPNAEGIFNSIIQSLLTENRVPKGDVLDVGANDGQWTKLYACCDKSRTVHAVDPDPRRMEYGRKNPKIFGENVRFHHYGVSNVNGNISLPIPGRSEYVSNPKMDASLRVTNQGNRPLMNLEIITISDFFEKIVRSRPGFLHIDVEGNEYK